MVAPGSSTTFERIAFQIIEQFEQAFKTRINNEGEFASIVVRREGKNMEIFVRSSRERPLITNAVRKALLVKRYDVSNLLIGGRSLFVKTNK